MFSLPTTSHLCNLPTKASVASKPPAGADVWFDESVCLAVVDEHLVCTIPFEHTGNALRQATDKHTLHHRDGVFDIGVATRMCFANYRRLALDGIQKLSIDTEFALLLAARNERTERGASFMSRSAAYTRLSIESDESCLPIVAQGTHDALRSDDVAAGARNRLERIHHLRHNLGRRLMVTVIPYNLGFRKRMSFAHTTLARRIGHLDDGAHGISNIVGLDRHLAFRLRRNSKLGPTERKIHRVASHIAKCSGTEIVERTPVEPMIYASDVLGVFITERKLIRSGSVADVRTHLRAAEPRIPIEVRRRLRPWKLRKALRCIALRPYRTVRPNVDLGNIAYNALL